MAFLGFYLIHPLLGLGLIFLLYILLFLALWIGLDWIVHMGITLVWKAKRNGVLYPDTLDRTGIGLVFLWVVFSCRAKILGF